MELEVLVSKKGTKVVTATHLHQLLELPNHHYSINVRRWLKDVYEFPDGIRRPVVMKDYAPRKGKDDSVVEDFYLSVELAKRIALHSRSRVKIKFARQLQLLEEEEGNTPGLNKHELMELMELAKAMCLRSCQEASENRHLAIYETRNGGSAANWWIYRAHVLGYSAETLRQELASRGLNSKGKTQRQMLQLTDPYELIRTGVIDHYMALNKTKDYACTMGDLAKSLAEEMELEVFDDRLSGNMFAPEVNTELLQQVKASRARERA